jgi:hypothetical protein
MGYLAHKKMIALAAISLMLTAAIAVVVVTAGNASALNDQTPTVSVDDQAAPTDLDPTMHNLTVQVCGKIEGKKVPIEGADLSVFSVNVTKGENTTTIVLEKVADAQTDDNGTAVFNLPDGKYVVRVDYHGLHGFGKVNLNDDESDRVMLHNWSHERSEHMGVGKKVCLCGEN